MRAFARAEPGPVVSRPSASSVAARLASSRSAIRAVPLYASVIGPTLILTLPLKVVGSTTSDSSAPGTQPTTLFTSIRYANTLSGGAPTLKQFSSCIAPLKVAQCKGSLSARLVDRHGPGRRHPLG